MLELVVVGMGEPRKIRGEGGGNGKLRWGREAGTEKLVREGGGTEKLERVSLREAEGNNWRGFA
jgi:hypothetical protein